MKHVLSWRNLLMRENLSLYHIFYTVGRTGSISQAARELYISQPAITKAIKKLEENLDTVLFKRTSRGVTLTPDGSFLFEKTKSAFSLLSEGEKGVLHNHSREIPKLRLGASATLSKYVLLPHLKRYIASNPQVQIQLSCQSTYETLRSLEDGKIDLGLIGKPQKLSQVHFMPLRKIQDTFVASPQYLSNHQAIYPEHPLTETATFMLLDGENISRQWVNLQLREQQIELCHIFEVNTMDLLIEFSQIGLGIACVIREFVQHQLEHGTLQEIPLGLTFPPREIGFVCRKKEEDSPLLHDFFSRTAI